MQNCVLVPFFSLFFYIFFFNFDNANCVDIIVFCGMNVPCSLFVFLRI